MSPTIPRGSTGIKVYCQNQKIQDSAPCLVLDPSEATASPARLTCRVESSLAFAHWLLAKSISVSEWAWLIMSKLVAAVTESGFYHTTIKSFLSGGRCQKLGACQLWTSRWNLVSLLVLSVWGFWYFLKFQMHAWRDFGVFLTMDGVLYVVCSVCTRPGSSEVSQRLYKRKAFEQKVNQIPSMQWSIFISLNKLKSLWSEKKTPQNFSDLIVMFFLKYLVLHNYVLYVIITSCFLINICNRYGYLFLWDSVALSKLALLSFE